MHGQVGKRQTWQERHTKGGREGEIWRMTRTGRQTKRERHTHKEQSQLGIFTILMTSQLHHNDITAIFSRGYSLVMKLINSDTHSCMHSLASLAIFPLLGMHFFMILLTLAIGRNRSCSRSSSAAGRSSGSSVTVTIGTSWSSWSVAAIPAKVTAIGCALCTAKLSSPGGGSSGSSDGIAFVLSPVLLCTAELVETQ